MSKGQWVKERSRLALRLPDLSLVYPSAASIFRTVYMDEREVLGHQCNAVSVDLPDVSCSRVAAIPALRIDHDSQALTASLGVLGDGSFISLTDDTDQVLIGTRWFPVVLEDLRNARAAAERLGVIGRPLLLSGIVRLRRATDLPFRLIDNGPTDSRQLITHIAPQKPITGIEARLYPYQTEGVRFLKMIADQGIGCILADEMGLGKTLQIISLIRAELDEGRRPFLVVAPATLLENWRREIVKFAPSISVQVHAGSRRAGVAGKLLQADVTVLSYDTAVSDEPLLSDVAWNLVILDEAQAIKNPAAQRTTAVKRLPRRVGLAVTGTPLENRIDDLWSITDFCLQGLLGDLDSFRAEFRDELGDAARVAPIVGPLILRRRVSEVAQDLPQRIEVRQAIEMSSVMATEYEKIRTETLESYGSGAGLVATSRLRSFCAHPSLVQGWSADPAEAMPKYARLLEILEEVFSLGEKALLFSTFQGVADIFERDLPTRFREGFYAKIDGRTSVDGRQGVVDAFFGHTGYGALFLNPKAAGTGLNITAANHVVHFNPEWNPALTAQASARSFRRKQTRPVTIHHLFFADSIEEVIVSRADFKTELAQNAVRGHGGDVPTSVITEALRISPIHHSRVTINDGSP